MKIAVLGLGTMGAPMATNLIKAGCEVTVYNRTRVPGGTARQAGCVARREPRGGADGGGTSS